MHFGDTIFIFVLALVVFGPKKLPEIGRQIGKLLVEFRRASNDFKMQIEDELRASEEAERQKQIAAAAPPPPPAQLPEPEPAAQTAAEASAPTILPPSEGQTVSRGGSWNDAAELETSATEIATEEAAAELHSAAHHADATPEGYNGSPLPADQAAPQHG